MQLYIGNKNYSSWSLRAWLMLEKNGIKFEEIKLPLATPAFYEALKAVTPSLKVPSIIDNDIHVWDSLAICEYINDVYLSGRAWPESMGQKTKARAVACEMHSGFGALRNEMPMNIRAKRSLTISDACKKDIARIEQIWAEQMKDYADEGGWLFGDWSIADAMFAPVVMRFQTYGIVVSSQARLYMDKVLSCSVLGKWIDEALQETDIVTIDEAGTELE
ncbi:MULTISPECIES: glutathione S-transferase family protein [Pseudoalteromonas]|uniref:Glutathione S-transferase n=1 Tax=Pseudoalteromonas amylolytica TaxID=1859457 RepID=A0A1S1MQS8_9GAMM|nr:MULTISPECIES: glutathione S-transferase family protein [Pseudoalteromonas]MCF6436279.1 glutathione S-transferase family protein [Pseudoalteromonas sp. MMG022]OHU86796.1 glutathione S-transferase [Pseudoalteromonas sp. JW3]OHU88679.1 glutathione S-transferase [Pseudoalteromonas amylolytica]